MTAAPLPPPAEPTVPAGTRSYDRKTYIAEGHGWRVDLDLEKFFDRVSHDKLMGQIAKRVGDKRLLKLIRALLNAGVMENGLVSPSEEGTPQGGPLSPLLSNLVLDSVSSLPVSRASTNSTGSWSAVAIVS